VACLLYKKEAGRFKILLVERANEKGHWQLPQGGTDSDDFMTAGERELKEEVGTDKFRPIAGFKNIYKYNFIEFNMIKRAIFLLIFTIFLISTASAEIIIQNQPNSVYNLGDTLTISATVKSLVSATDTLYMDLICEGQSVNFYKNGVSLSSGEEKEIEASLIFTKNLIGEIKGKCKVKGTFKGDYILTDEFSVSNKINLIPESNNTIFTPGVPASIKGSALGENGEPANGFIDIRVIEGESVLLNKHDTINNGFFSIDIVFPEDIKAGRYLLELSAYEEEPGETINEKTNLGFTAYNVDVTQVPTSLEIILDKEVMPGTNARIKAVLHDQTGKNINSMAKITIKDDKQKIMEQTEKATDEYLEVPIVYNQKSSVWEVSAEFDSLIAESTFLIKEKKDVNVSLVNNTLMITNVGNVPYNDTVSVKIGDTPLNVETNLKIDEVQKYWSEVTNISKEQFRKPFFQNFLRNRSGDV